MGLNSDPQHPVNLGVAAHACNANARAKQRQVDPGSSLVSQTHRNNKLQIQSEILSQDIRCRRN